VTVRPLETQPGCDLGGNPRPLSASADVPSLQQSYNLSEQRQSRRLTALALSDGGKGHGAETGEFLGYDLRLGTTGTVGKTKSYGL
jgi:hypothetical protein